MSRIIVGVDGSGQSLAVAGWDAEEAHRRDVPVVVRCPVAVIPAAGASSGSRAGQNGETRET